MPPGEDKVLYTFTVNQTSGVIEKTLSAKKDGERFILHTNDGELLSSDYNVTDGKFVAELRRGEISSDLVLLDTERGDYVSITDGDSRDENRRFPKSARASFCTILWRRAGTRGANSSNMRLRPFTSTISIPST